MTFRCGFTIVSKFGLAGSSVTTNAQPLRARYENARQIAGNSDGGRYSLDVDAAHRRLDISRSTHLVVMDPDSEEVVGDSAGAPPADFDLPAAGAEG
jgi:hypothetical protein